MKVSHHPLPPVPASHGAERGNRPADAAGGASTSTLAPAVEVSLSDEGRRISGQGQSGKPEAPGAHSVAHRARALIEQYPELADQPFGRLVSSLARGDFVAPVATPPVEGETPPADDATTDGTTTDGTGEIPPSDEGAETPGTVAEGETPGEDTVLGTPEESETVAGDGGDSVGSGEESAAVLPDPSLEGTDTLIGEIIEALDEESEAEV